MVLYYTGTGNSAYIARRIAAAIDDECINLFEKLRNNDYSELMSEKPFVIAAPTYCWQLPRIVRDWLLNVKLSGSNDIYFVLSCGGEIGDAARYAKKICDEKMMSFKGCAEVLMPENYIAMFSAPNREQAIEIINKAESQIDDVIGHISSGTQIKNKPSGVVDRLKSSLINLFFYPLCLHSKKFTVSDACIGCGKCASSCVMNNIKMLDGRPSWADNCTHCMACICGCPAEAIEYGNVSKGQPRYNCPK